MALRVSGIYGPHRLPLDRLRHGEPVLRAEDSAPGNRIHVDDLVAACLAALVRLEPLSGGAVKPHEQTFSAAKADRLNAYFYQTGTPDSFQADLDRYKGVTAADVQRVVKQYLRTNRVMASVVPQGKPDLAAKKALIP